jgi:predicted nuclease of predicted toxin-antitoxin system
MTWAPGATDCAIHADANQTHRTIVTHDDDYLSPAKEPSPRVFYIPNQRLSTFTLFRIINRVNELYSTQESMPRVVYLTDEWLE